MRRSACLGELSRMGLQLGNLGVFGRLESASVEVVLLESAAELLKSTAAYTEHGERLGHGIVVPDIHLRVKVCLVFVCGILLIQSIQKLALLWQISILAYSLMPMAKSCLIARLEYSFLPCTQTAFTSARSMSFSAMLHGLPKLAGQSPSFSLGSPSSRLSERQASLQSAPQ